MNIVSERDISPCIRFIREELSTGLVGVEIGIWDGGNATAALQHLLPERYYMVDPYVEYGDNDFTQDLFEEMYQGMRNKFETFSNVIIKRMTSLEASKVVENNLDFVYIDGAHDYENKMIDLEAWYPKIKIGGVICGDDYNIESTANAVDYFAKKYGIKFTISTDSEPHPPEYWAVRTK